MHRRVDDSPRRVLVIGAACIVGFIDEERHARLQAALLAGAALPHSLNPVAIRQLPDALRSAYLQSFARALHTVYLTAACVVILAFALARLIKNHPLRKH
jgi:hypothetical protein